MEPLSDRLAKLPPEKIALLMERLRARDAADPPPATGIPRRAGDGPAPASFAQQRLWFVDRLEAGTWAYNVLSVTRFDGDLDVGAMRRALDGVVRRHEALRTVFAERDGAPVQVVVPGTGAPLELEDLAGLPVEEREAELARRVNREPRRPLDLAAGPLLRCSLLRLAADRHVLLLTLHHIISDGWSRGILVREISALYAAFVRGEEPALPPPTLQYPDYAAWQREWLQGAELERQLGYWTGRLRGAPPALEVPADHPRPPLQSFEGGLHRFRVPGALAEALRRLARREESTPFMLLLAAFKTLLLRLTGESDLVVGTPVANRGRVETEDVVGFFANTLALRTGLQGDPSFREVLGRVRETALGAYAHEELPFERLVEALRPERDLSRSPVFQVMFLLDNTPVKTLRLPGVSLVPVDVETGISSFDLTLMVEEKEDGLAAGLEYATALFDPDTVARMAECFLTLLEGIAADPDLPVGRLPLLAPAERRRLVVELNRTAEDFPELAPVHRMFEAQARRAPDAPAVVSAAGTLTYGELQSRGAGIARALRERGAGPESRVGLLAGRSAEAVAAMLGILGAGAAYVPLDPEYPAERLRFMAGDAGVSLVLATRDAADPAGAGWNAPLLLLDDLAAAGPSGEDAGELPAEVDMACAAYAIYTSGSTGTPKGVVVEHRSLANYVAAARRAYGLAPGDRVLHSAPLGFDISVEEVFPTLCAGAALVLRSPGAPGSADAFLDEAAAAGVTVISFPTALWHEVTLRLEAGARLPAALRLAVLGGERAQPDRVAAWRAHAPAGVRLVNSYGPTEATVVATLHELSAADGGRVPIGAPVANLAAHVLDGAGEPAPVGVPGELYVGGAGVARGYLGRPAETAARFVPDPFAAEPGARLYRTGDRVRRHRDGTLDFLGRADEQLKLRGFRVEPGEVEAAIRADPRVERAAVVAREGGGGARLVAYFTPAPGAGEAGALADGLRATLAERLPAYMLPSAWVRVESWPLTPGGKTDVRALPAPADAAGPVPPERAPSALESVLAGAWAEALGVERLPLERSLFELGAHSLLVTRVLGRVRGLFGVEVPVRALFLRPTVAAMAEELLRAAPDPAAVERAAATVLQVSELSDEQVRALASSDPADGPPNTISR